MSRWKKKDKNKSQMEILELKSKISEVKKIIMGLITNWRWQTKG